MRRNGTADEALLRLVREHAGELLRFARRFSLCADDAQDAYQRALEIFVRRMRVEPPAQPLSWLRTVLRHEALAVRAQREQMLSREEIDLDRHEDRGLEDPADRAAEFERLARTAEALQRLKPQEITALRLRAEGRSYREIAELQSWSATKVNRCVTEGRRALLDRLAEIEAGEECARWQPALSALADGEASAKEVADLRPHLRTCAACRATLRQFHDAPQQVAALVPVVALAAVPHGGAGIVGQLEAAGHALLDRLTWAVVRTQSAFDAVPGGKLAAVAASTAAVAGGGAALQHVAHPAAHRAAAAVARVERASTGSLPSVRLPVPAARPASGSSGSREARKPAAEFSGRQRPEFTAEPQAAAAAASPPMAAEAVASTAVSAPATAPPSAEFAGP